MAMLCTTETQIEEIWKKEKPEAQAEAKGNIEKQHPKKSITMQQCRCMTPKLSPKLLFFGDLHQSQSPVGLFELEFCSTGASVSFSSSLAGFAALCKLRYGPPSTVKSQEGHGPSLLVAVETDTRSARSCGAHASGLGAESMGTANTRREKSLLMNRMTYARKQISRNGKGNRTF